MNRIVIIGNGFDLAHGLKTSYKDFIEWYWNHILIQILECNKKRFETEVSSFEINIDSLTWYVYGWQNGLSLRDMSGIDTINYMLSQPQSFTINFSTFFKRITQSIETKGWVDIENEYYKLLVCQTENNEYVDHPEKLNKELDYIKKLLIDYLTYIQEHEINKKRKSSLIQTIIYTPISSSDIAISSQKKWHDFIKERANLKDNEWRDLLRDYNLTKRTYNKNGFYIPDNIRLLNFNYTDTANLYLPNDSVRMDFNFIHGRLTDSNSIIFGYGDELDENYKTLLNKNDNAYLANIKSIKYLEHDSYRKLLQFIEADIYQIYILGHSCGNSDRTLLNTLFEHPNCVSIKPYYFKDYLKKTDNYTEIVQNISRNFTNMKLMRDKVVNKSYCEPFSIRTAQN